MQQMLKLAGLALLAVVLTLALAIAGLASLWGDICETVVHNQAAAPTSPMQSWVHGADCGAVASIAVTTVSIGPSDVRDPRGDERATALFRARVDRSSPLRVGPYGPSIGARWTGDSALTIRYDPRIDVDLAVLRIHGITVKYDTLP